MPSLENKGSSVAPATDVINLPGKMPRIPDAVLERFPDMEEYQGQLDRWWQAVSTTLSETNEDTATVVNQNYEGVKNLFVSVDGLSAEITELSEIVVTGDAILARRIVTVSAMAGIASNLTISPVEPGAPAVNDYWIDTAVPLTPVTYQWDGADWVEVLTPISLAGVQTEATARATADGFLEGKYTLTVVAGDVVTGMNITSASGPGVNVSEVTFQADKFQIYSGTTKKVMFVADAIDDVVRLADTLVVDAANGKVYIGTGTYADPSTPFYVDDTGRMSLNDKFAWDGSNLSITGTAQSGNYNPGVDGWLIDEAGNAEFNDVVIRGYLEASFIATNSSFYNTADSTKIMQAVTWQHAYSDNGGSGWNNMDITPIEVWLITFYGWTNASGSADITNRFGQADVQFTCIENGGCTPVVVGGYVDLEIIYRINGGATVQVTPFAARVTAASGSGSLNIAGGASPGGLAGGDIIEFGVRLYGALPADLVNVVDLTVSCVNI
jgi:hypothetical protein